MRCFASSAQQLLLSAKPVANNSAKSCAHPTRPAPLRRCAEFSEPCVELLVSQSQAGFPCCILPRTFPHSFQGLPRLIDLHKLRTNTLIHSLAAVEGFVANTCAGCPPAPLEQQPACSTAAGAGPSLLCYCPEFNAYLERCLELAQLNRQLGPAPYVLLLQILSRLNYRADPELQQSFSRFYLHLQVGLQEAVELQTEAITPQVALAVFEAWADIGAVPMKSATFGLALREHVKTALFAPQELARLLAAMAAIRGAHRSYRPCQYDLADIAGTLGASLQELANQHLASVAASLGAFPWPVYQCLVPLMEATAQEGVRRLAVGVISPPAGAALLAAAVASAHAMHPRLGADLEAKVAGWKAQARLCTGSNILAFEPAAAAAAAAEGSITTWAS